MKPAAPIDVLLIGDSIRLGYQPLVQAAVGGLVVISGPAENCRSTRDILSNFDEWLPPSALGPGKLVHLNAGLHDLRRTPATHGAPLVPLEEFTANLLTITSALTAHSGLEMILATTTPVDDARHSIGRTSDRQQRDVLAYNARLVAVATAKELRLNDLHGVVASDPARFLGPDGVHLSAAGNEVVAAAVASAIRSAVATAS